MTERKFSCGFPSRRKQRPGAREGSGPGGRRAGAPRSQSVRVSRYFFASGYSIVSGRPAAVARHLWAASAGPGGSRGSPGPEFHHVPPPPGTPASSASRGCFARASRISRRVTHRNSRRLTERRPHPESLAVRRRRRGNSRRVTHREFPTPHRAPTSSGIPGRSPQAKGNFEARHTLKTTTPCKSAAVIRPGCASRDAGRPSAPRRDRALPASARSAAPRRRGPCGPPRPGGSARPGPGA